MKFFICVIISFASMAFGMYLLIHDEFKTVAISAFATNVITFWTEAPKIKSDGTLRQPAGVGQI